MKKLSEQLEAVAKAPGICVHPGYVEVLRRAIALAKRYEDAATGECVEAGSMPGLEGDPFVGIIIESTPGELKRGPSIVYKRVRILLDTEG